MVKFLKIYLVIYLLSLIAPLVVFSYAISSQIIDINVVVPVIAISLVCILPTYSAISSMLDGKKLGVMGNILRFFVHLFSVITTIILILFLLFSILMGGMMGITDFTGYTAIASLLIFIITFIYLLTSHVKTKSGDSNNKEVNYSKVYMLLFICSVMFLCIMFFLPIFWKVYPMRYYVINNTIIMSIILLCILPGNVAIITRLNNRRDGVIKKIAIFLIHSISVIAIIWIIWFLCYAIYITIFSLFFIGSNLGSVGVKSIIVSSIAFMSLFIFTYSLFKKRRKFCYDKIL